MVPDRCPLHAAKHALFGSLFPTPVEAPQQEPVPNQDHRNDFFHTDCAVTLHRITCSS
jgi:hypothetical protein